MLNAVGYFLKTFRPVLADEVIRLAHGATVILEVYGLAPGDVPALDSGLATGLLAVVLSGALFAVRVALGPVVLHAMFDLLHLGAFVGFFEEISILALQALQREEIPLAVQNARDGVLETLIVLCL